MSWASLNFEEVTDLCDRCRKRRKSAIPTPVDKEDNISALAFQNLGGISPVESFDCRTPIKLRSDVENSTLSYVPSPEDDQSFSSVTTPGYLLL
jgi:hypothetical protein